MLGNESRQNWRAGSGSRAKPRTARQTRAFAFNSQFQPQNTSPYQANIFIDTSASRFRDRHLPKTTNPGFQSSTLPGKAIDLCMRQHNEPIEKYYTAYFIGCDVKRVDVENYRDEPHSKTSLLVVVWSWNCGERRSSELRSAGVLLMVLACRVPSLRPELHDCRTRTERSLTRLGRQAVCLG